MESPKQRTLVARQTIKSLSSSPALSLLHPTPDTPNSRSTLIIPSIVSIALVYLIPL
jgi:hypothetical protein